MSSRRQTAPTEFVEAGGIRFASRKKRNQNMKTKQIKLPGPDHPISIERNPARVVVSVAGRVIADTRSALTLREATYPPVEYIPRKDVDFSQLERTGLALPTVRIKASTAELTARPLVILVVGDCFHLPLQAKCIELVQG